MKQCAPYWISLPNTNAEKLGGASYETAEQAIRAAQERPERPLVVYATMPVMGILAPSVVRVIH